MRLGDEDRSNRTEPRALDIVDGGNTIMTSFKLPLKGFEFCA